MTKSAKHWRSCAVLIWAAMMLGMLAGAPSGSLAGEADDSAGWKPLFNGKNFDGWYLFLQKSERDTDPHRVATIEDGTIHVYKYDRNGSEVVMGYMGTKAPFANYHLKVEYRWGKNQFKPRYLYKPDAGVYFHHVGADAVWPEALQLQVELNGVGDLITAGPIRFETTVDPSTLSDSWQEYLPVGKGGVAYTTAGKGITYTRKYENFEADGWNRVDLICRGGEAVALVNGRVVNRGRNIQQRVGEEWKSLEGGRILLEFEASEMWWRNVEIRDLGQAETMDQAIARAEREARTPESAAGRVAR